MANKNGLVSFHSKVAAGVVSVVTVLCGVIGTLYSEANAQSKEAKAWLIKSVHELKIDSEACETDREKLRLEIESLSSQMNYLKGVVESNRITKLGIK